MTKFEWESELRKNIHRLPKIEIDQIFEYYNEIFNDKIESGMKEGEIIAEFGNPIDVADKILSDYNIAPSVDIRTETSTYRPVVDTPVFKRDPEFTRDKEYIPSQEERKRAMKNERKYHKNPYEYKKPHSSNGWRVFAFIVCTVLFGGLAIGLVTSAVTLIFSGVVGGVVVALGGIAGAVWYGSVITTSFYVGLVQIGICLAVSGAGILMSVISVKLGKVLFRLGKKLFKWLGKVYTGKKEALYEK